MGIILISIVRKSLNGGALAGQAFVIVVFVRSFAGAFAGETLAREVLAREVLAREVLAGEVLAGEAGETGEMFAGKMLAGEASACDISSVVAQSDQRPCLTLPALRSTCAL
jgi:hypothetical protein